MTLFLQNDARINRADNFGQTALFYAAEHGQTSVVKYLLSLDADISIRCVELLLFINVSTINGSA